MKNFILPGWEVTGLDLSRNDAVVHIMVEGDTFHTIGYSDQGNIDQDDMSEEQVIQLLKGLE